MLAPGEFAELLQESMLSREPLWAECFVSCASTELSDSGLSR